MGSNKMNNRDSLRTQIIEAMRAYDIKLGRNDWSMDDIFDEAIMPVLDAAMKAGELLMHRATTPQLPVNDSIMAWLQGCCAVIAGIHLEEHTVSKRELLKVLYQLEAGANTAVAEARSVNQNTTASVTGKLLAGLISPPRKDYQ